MILDELLNFSPTLLFALPFLLFLHFPVRRVVSVCGRAQIRITVVSQTLAAVTIGDSYISTKSLKCLCVTLSHPCSPRPARWCISSPLARRLSWCLASRPRTRGSPSSWCCPPWCRRSSSCPAPAPRHSSPLSLGSDRRRTLGCCCMTDTDMKLEVSKPRAIFLRITLSENSNFELKSKKNDTLISTLSIVLLPSCGLKVF